jgi:uncharacterized protein (DUF2141 family)
MNDRKRLARMVRVKTSLENVRKSELALASRTLHVAEARADEAKAHLTQTLEVLRAAAVASPVMLADAAFYAADAGDRLRRAETVVAACKEDQQRKLGMAAAARRDVRTLEVLDARTKRRERTRLDQQEQDANDELAAQRGGRR